MDKSLVESYFFPLEPQPTGLIPKGTLRHAPACILFDVYGTLFISASGDIQASKKRKVDNRKLTQLLDNFQIDLPVKSLKRNLVEAIKNAHGIMKNQGVDYPEVEIDRIWMRVLNLTDRAMAKIFAVQYEMIVNPVWPMPGLDNLIRLLQARAIPMGIISNAQFYTPSLFLWFLGSYPEKLGFKKDLLLYSYRLGHAKPSSFLFQMAADRLETAGISPGQTLYIGNDMLNDILPAATAGFQTALFAGDKRSLRMRSDDKRLNDTSPNLIVTELSQLSAHLGAEPRPNPRKGTDNDH